MRKKIPYNSTALYLAVFLGFLFCSTSRAQNAPSTGFGMQPNQSYTLSNIETVNNSNGNLMYQIPLASLPPGRGINPTVSLRYTASSMMLPPLRHRQVQEPKL